MDLESFDQVLKTARSVRRKLDFEREVPLRIVEDCIDVAVQAPVGIGGENWRFVVVTDSGVKSQLAKTYNEAIAEFASLRSVELKPAQQALMSRLHEMPCIILVCAIGKPGEASNQQTAFYGSILPAAWSLMLALRARNLGATWTSLLTARQLEVGKILGIPMDVTQTVMLPVAYTKGAVMKVADRLPARAVTFVNRWGER